MNHYEIPNWAGKPPTGLHLDVLKGDKLIQKLMLDQKKCYLFGRNPQMNDFCIDHASCSRVHAAFVYHKHLNRAFLVDLGSTHGTYIGKMRLESNKPTQLPIDSMFHFGASTRNYVIRERPSGNTGGIMEDLPSMEAEGALLGLPETQTELDNLTEFNTAHNRRISMLGISTDDGADAIKPPGTGLKRSASTGGHSGPIKKQKRGVSFNEDVDIINPEDIDPTVGRFRNLIKTTIVPTANSLGTRKMKLQNPDEGHHHSLRLTELARAAPLYADLPAPTSHVTPVSASMSLLGARLGLSLPNPAPDVDLSGLEGAPHTAMATSNPSQTGTDEANASNEPKKKKYAKEAWPGRKPSLIPGV